MATAALLGTATWTTSNGSKTVTATPTVGDLIVIAVAHSGNTGFGVPTDNQSGTYVAVGSTGVKNGSADGFNFYVRTSLVSSAVSTIYTTAPGATSGGGLAVIRVSGLTRTGTSAVRQTSKSDNAAAGSTAVSFSAAALTGNPCLGLIFNATSPAGLTPPSGWSELVDLGYSTPTSGIEVASINSGFTSSTVTWGSNSGSAWGGMVLELDTSAVAYTMTADPASFTLTGNNAGTTKGFLATADPGTFSLTGPDAGLYRGWTMQAETALVVPSNVQVAQTSSTSLTVSFTDVSHTLTGNDATLTYSTSGAYTLTAAVGAFTLTGNDAGTLKQSVLPTSVGSFALTSIDTYFDIERVVDGTVGSFTVTGNDATLTYTPTSGAYTLVADSATFTVGTSSTGLTRQAVLPTTVGAFALTGNAANTTKQSVLPTTVGAFSLSGQDAQTTRQLVLGTSVGAFTLNGSSVNLPWTHNLTADVASFTLTGNAAALSYSSSTNTTMTVTAGSFLVDGSAADLTLHRKLTADAASYGLTGNDSVFAKQSRLSATVASYDVTGYPVTLTTSTPAAFPVLPHLLTVVPPRHKLTVSTDKALLSVDRTATN
jgi:hypothetical protein